MFKAGVSPESFGHCYAANAVFACCIDRVSQPFGIFLAEKTQRFSIYS
jgi:hypothetical protein